MTELPPIITSSKDLRKACDLLSRQPFVTVDTEFMRQTTYRPSASFLKIATKAELSITITRANHVHRKGHLR